MESISINDWFWFQLKNYLISFDYQDLPKGIHFTIAFNENSKFINLHLTKNIKQKKESQENKKNPRIDICIISKNDFIKIVPKVSLVFLNQILEEVIRKKHTTI